jgi:hypothetical protein
MRQSKMTVRDIDCGIDDVQSTERSLERFVLQTESKDLLFEMLKDHFTPNDCNEFRTHYTFRNSGSSFGQ